MFDRFTERARQVMEHSRQEAENLRNDYIGTEHLLLALVREETGVPAHVLKKLAVDSAKVRSEVDLLVEMGTTPATGNQLPFTPRVKRVLEYALDEAGRFGHDFIGTEHLLLGVLREKDGPAGHVLQRLGVRSEDVRAKVLEAIGVDPSAVPAEPPPRGWFARIFGRGP